MVSLINRKSLSGKKYQAFLCMFTMWRFLTGEHHKVGDIPSPPSTTQFMLWFYWEQKSIISISLSKQLSVKTAVRMEVVALDQIVVHVSMDSLAPSVREVRNMFSYYHWQNTALGAVYSSIYTRDTQFWVNFCSIPWHEDSALNNNLMSKAILGIPTDCISVPCLWILLIPHVAPCGSFVKYI